MSNNMPDKMCPINNISHLLALLALLVLLTACAPPRFWFSVDGQVLDWPSEKPIADAVVVFTWRGMRGLVGDSSSTCFHVEVDIADEQGKFEIPFWFTGPTFDLKRRVHSSFYKPGYKLSTYTIPKSIGARIRQDKEKGLYYLEDAERSVDKELENIAGMMGELTCSTRWERREYFPVYKRLYTDAKQIAGKDVDNIYMKNIRRYIVRTWEHVDKSVHGLKTDVYFEKYLKDNFE